MWISHCRNPLLTFMNGQVPKGRDGVYIEQRYGVPYQRPILVWQKPWTGCPSPRGPWLFYFMIMLSGAHLDTSRLTTLCDWHHTYVDTSVLHLSPPFCAELKAHVILAKCLFISGAGSRFCLMAGIPGRPSCPSGVQIHMWPVTD